MRKFFVIISVLVVLIIIVGFVIWKNMKIENITDDLYIVNGNSIYQMNIAKFVFNKLYSNQEYNFIKGKIMKVTNIPAVFLKDTFTNEQNVITAWISKADNTKVKIVEINSRLHMTKVYEIKINLGPDFELLDPVYDMRTARGSADAFGLGCNYGNHDSCIWIIPKVEPLKGPNDYVIKGIKVKYRDAIAYPVIVRFYNKVEYKHMYETLYLDQPELKPGE